MTSWQRAYYSQRKTLGVRHSSFDFLWNEEQWLSVGTAFKLGRKPNYILQHCSLVLVKSESKIVPSFLCERADGKYCCFSLISAILNKREMWTAARYNTNEVIPKVQYCAWIPQVTARVIPALIKNLKVNFKKPIIQLIQLWLTVHCKHINRIANKGKKTSYRPFFLNSFSSFTGKIHFEVMHSQMSVQYIPHVK